MAQGKTDARAILSDPRSNQAGGIRRAGAPLPPLILINPPNGTIGA
jgi:hypothetical protein